MLNTPAGMPVFSAARMIASATHSAVAMCPLWALNTTGQPAASAEAVSPPAVENASGKLLAPNTATGPRPMRYWRRSGRGNGLTLRQCPVDARTVEITATQHFGEQAHLAAGATALALNPAGRQRGFAADHGDELIAQRIQFIGDGIEKLRASLGAQAAIGRVSGGRGLGGGIDFFAVAWIEIVGQGFAGAGVDALQR